jgi:HK97 family phage portal protein
MNRFFRWFQRKDSQARIAFSLNVAGQAVTTPANYLSLASQGYSKNSVAFRSVNLIARSGATIPINLFKKRGDTKEELFDHPLKSLIERPNPLQAQSQFFESVLSSYMISGNSYIESVKPSPTRPPMELYQLRPDRVKIVPAKNGFPSQYVYEANGNKVVYPVDFVKMTSPVLHVKTFNPLNDWYGMSPLEAAILSLDQMNSANKWNLSTLQNSATPSGVLTVEPSDVNPGGTLTTEQFDKLKADIEERYSGHNNTGRPMLLEGGMKWTQMSLSPKDMDFLNSKNVTARDIASVFGVPPLLLNISGDNTYSNFKEARLSLYEETVIPIMSLFVDELNRWLTPYYGEDLSLEMDLDAVPAIQEKREARFTSINSASFLTVNEKREAMGYDEKPGWDVFVIGPDILPASLNAEEEFTPAAPVEPPPAPVQPVEPPPVEPPPPEPTMDQVDQQVGQMNMAQLLDVKFFNPINKIERRRSLMAQNRIKDSLAHDFADDLSEEFRDLASHVSRMAEDLDPKLVEFAVTQKVDELFKPIEKTIKKHIRRAAEKFGRLAFDQASKHLPNHIELKAGRKAELKFGDFVTRFTETRSAVAIGKVEDTSKKEVVKVVRSALTDFLTDGNFSLAKRIREDLGTISKARSETIARTEVNIASNTGGLEAVRSLEVPGMMKEWVSTIDKYSRDDSNVSDHVSMNEVKVGIDDKFSVPPDAEMEGPGDPSAGPEQVINCRCVTVYGVN